MFQEDPRQISFLNDSQSNWSFRSFTSQNSPLNCIFSVDSLHQQNHQNSTDGSSQIQQQQGQEKKIRNIEKRKQIKKLLKWEEKKKKKPQNQTKNEKQIKSDETPVLVDQSQKKNFPLLLTRKIKQLMKNILEIKKRGTLPRQTSIKKVYYFLFHQKLKKNQSWPILQAFLINNQENQAVILNQKDLQDNLEQMAKQYSVIQRQKIQTLRSYLRDQIIQRSVKLLEIAAETKIKNKQNKLNFIGYVKQFLIKLKLGVGKFSRQ